MAALPRSDQERGAAAVEFALVLPVLLLLVFGLIDFSRAFNAHVSLSGAAREGARATAMKNPDWEAITIAAAPSLTGVTATQVAECTTGAGPAEVQASYDYNFVTPVGAFMAWFGGGSGTMSNFTLTGIGVMRCGG